MRSLCVTLGILSCVGWAVSTSAGMTARGVAANTPVPEEASVLLEEIKRIGIVGKSADCDTLEPVPLYDGAPELGAWIAFCRMVVDRDNGGCAALPAMIVPDLRSLCLQAESLR